MALAMQCVYWKWQCTLDAFNTPLWKTLSFSQDVKARKSKIYGLIVIRVLLIQKNKEKKRTQSKKERK